MKGAKQGDGKELTGTGLREHITHPPHTHTQPASCLGPPALLTSSAGRVQLRVHTRGSHAPVASQKGATAPEMSTIGTSDLPKSVPLVPRDTMHWPPLPHRCKGDTRVWYGTSLARPGGAGGAQGMRGARAAHQGRPLT